MKLLIILLIFSSQLLAADPLVLSTEETNPDTEVVLIKKPEKYLRNESMIYDLNTNLGIKDQRKYTGNDRNKFAVAGHVSSHYERFNELFGFEFNYMRRTQRYDQIWYGAQVYQNRAFFDAITRNQPPRAGDNPNDDSQFPRPNNVKNSVLAFGPGLGYRFKLLLDFYPMEDVFETVEVFGNYVTLNETFIGQRYTGYGMTANYGVHKRSSTKLYYGGKLSYNIASVTREALGTESKSDRSFALGWLSLGLELGFYY